MAAARPACGQVECGCCPDESDADPRGSCGPQGRVVQGSPTPTTPTMSRPRPRSERHAGLVRAQRRAVSSRLGVARLSGPSVRRGCPYRSDRLGHRQRPDGVTCAWPVAPVRQGRRRSVSGTRGRRAQRSLWAMARRVVPGRRARACGALFRERSGRVPAREAGALSRGGDGRTRATRRDQGAVPRGGATAAQASRRTISHPPTTTATAA